MNASQQKLGQRKAQLYRGIDQLSAKVQSVNTYRAKLDYREKELTLRELSLKSRWQSMVTDLLGHDDPRTQHERDRQAKG